MGAARVSKHIAHRDNKKNMQETLVCGQVSQLQDLLFLLEEKTRHKLHRRDRRLSLSPLCESSGVPQRLGAGLDPAPFLMWCSHRGAKSTWTSMDSREITSSSPFWKKKWGRLLHRRQAEKPGFILESRKLLPVVWSSPFRKRAHVKYCIKDILIAILTSTCQLKHNPKQCQMPPIPAGISMLFIWCSSMNRLRNFSAMEIKGLSLSLK